MRAAFLPSLLSACLALAGCSDRAEDAVSVVVLGGEAEARRAIRAATVEGLVGVDAEGRIVPALADRWIVTDDGQSYIFRLRDGTWADGSPLTGESARTALRQALANLRKSPLRLDFADIEEVRAMAGRVVELRLARPVPDLLQLLAQPELGLERRGRGAGPMSLRREGGAIALSPIPPEQRGLPAQADWAERASTIRLTTAAPEDAVRRFADGKAQVVLGGTFAEWPAVLASSLPGQAIRVDPALGLFGLAPTHHDGFLAEPENREAISLLIDREAFADALRGPGWSPTARIVDPGFTDAAELVRERWTGLTMEQRRAVAQSRITRWRSRKGEVTLRIALPTGPGADLLFNRLTADLGAAGLKVQRSELGKPADLELIDAVAPYHSPRWVFLRLSCQSRPASCSPAADVAFAQAIALTDEGARAPALAEAEARLTADNTFIPLGPPLRWTLASPDTDGIFPNAWALHPLLPLAVRADK